MTNESIKYAGIINAVNNTFHYYHRHLYRYLNEFISLNCSADLLARGIYPDAKEITESMAAFNAVRRWCRTYDMNDDTILAVFPGDGSTPRTAALFAFRTKWQCISVDPALKKTDWGIDHLICIKERIENVTNEMYSKKIDVGKVRKVIFVAVHAHCTIQEILGNFNHPIRTLVAIPCCVPYNDLPADKEYIDHCIFSPENTVKIWRGV